MPKAKAIYLRQSHMELARMARNVRLLYSLESCRESIGSRSVRICKNCNTGTLFITFYLLAALPFAYPRSLKGTDANGSGLSKLGTTSDLECLPTTVLPICLQITKNGRAIRAQSESGSTPDQRRMLLLLGYLDAAPDLT